MKNAWKKSFILMALVLLCSSSASATACPRESAWENELGSTLYIEDISSEGKITGVYINMGQEYGCQNTPYPVTGWIMENGRALTFMVKWQNAVENCHAVTTWTGFLSSDGNTLTTLWQMVVNGTTSTSQILQGEDAFKKIPPKSSPFRIHGLE